MPHPRLTPQVCPPKKPKAEGRRPAARPPVDLRRKNGCCGDLVGGSTMTNHQGRSGDRKDYQKEQGNSPSMRAWLHSFLPGHTQRRIVARSGVLVDVTSVSGSPGTSFRQKNNRRLTPPARCLEQKLATCCRRLRARVPEQEPVSLSLQGPLP